jgi:hypothetical protein
MSRYSLALVKKIKDDQKVLLVEKPEDLISAIKDRLLEKLPARLVRGYKPAEVIQALETVWKEIVKDLKEESVRF